MTDQVVIKDIEMKFWSMVIFQVRWVVAAIPAIMILIFIWFFTAGFIAAMFRG